jgi:phosphatidylserine/phosphatidylglycerophosphate/cardiolipin synthase-like enzyme
MHAKVSIIDNKHLVIGSANYSYSAFYKNYEYIIFEKRWIKEFEGFFNYLKENSTPYRLSY